MEIAIILLATTSIVFLFVLMFNMNKGKPMFNKVNNIFMEGEKPDKPNYNLKILVTVVCICVVLAFIVSTMQLDLISINNATQEELMTLYGIGEVKSMQIIELRSNKKLTIQDFIDVVGKNTYINLKDLIKE